MSKNETGEFELVLGNKQLLSVFFIVVILLGVFFTMGYIVGRNSSPPPLEASNRKSDGRPLIVDSPNAPPPSQIPNVTETKPAVEEPKPVVPPKTEPKPEVKPPDPKPQEKPKDEKAKPVEKEKEKEKEKNKPAVEVAAGNTGASPARGSQYLQVQALPTEQAALVIEVLRKKGFTAATESVPNKPGLTRILVGPIEAGTANDVKDRLDQAGFKGKQAMLRKF